MAAVSPTDGPALEKKTAKVPCRYRVIRKLFRALWITVPQPPGRKSPISPSERSGGRGWGIGCRRWFKGVAGLVNHRAGGSLPLSVHSGYINPWTAYNSVDALQADLPSLPHSVPQSPCEDSHANTQVEIQSAVSLPSLRMEGFSAGLSALEGSSGGDQENRQS